MCVCVRAIAKNVEYPTIAHCQEVAPYFRVSIFNDLSWLKL